MDFALTDIVRTFSLDRPIVRELKAREVPLPQIENIRFLVIKDLGTNALLNPFTLKDKIARSVQNNLLQQALARNGVAAEDMAAQLDTTNKELKLVGNSQLSYYQLGNVAALHAAKPATAPAGTELSSAVTQVFAERFAEGVQSFSPAERAVFEGGGVKIHGGLVTLDMHNERTPFTNNDIYGRTHANHSAGIFWGNANKVTVSQWSLLPKHDQDLFPSPSTKTVLDGTFQRQSDHIIAHTVRHELGHTMDVFVPNMRLSQTPRFIKAATEDLEKLGGAAIAKARGHAYFVNKDGTPNEPELLPS